MAKTMATAPMRNKKTGRNVNKNKNNKGKKMMNKNMNMNMNMKGRRKKNMKMRMRKNKNKKKKADGDSAPSPATTSPSPTDTLSPTVTTPPTSSSTASATSSATYSPTSAETTSTDDSSNQGGNNSAGTKDGEAPIVKNIGYLFMGYDLLKGNPMEMTGTTTIDVGLRENIFAQPDFTTMADQEYKVPKGVFAVECMGCNMAFTSTVMSSSKDYVSSLSSKVSASASASYGAFSGSFSASKGYKEANSRMNSQGESTTSSEISCCVYDAQLQTNNMPEYSDNFKNRVEKMRNADEDALNATVKAFVSEFGTHYISQVTMGSLYGKQSYISKSKLKEMSSSSSDISATISASGGVGLFSASASGSYDKSKSGKSNNSFNKDTSHTNVYSRGATPPANGDIGTWLKKSADNPMPTKMNVRPIQELDAYGDDEKGKEVKKQLEDYLFRYCQDLNPGNCNPPGTASPYTEKDFETPPPVSDYNPEMNYKNARKWGFNTGYACKSNQAYVGLGWNQGSTDISYSAYLGYYPDNAKHGGISAAGMSEDSEYKKHFSHICDAGQAIVDIESWGGGDNYDGDRAFAFQCASFDGMKIANYGYDGGNWKRFSRPSQQSDMANLGWVGPEDSNPGNFQCNPNHVITAVESMFTGKEGGMFSSSVAGTRQWKFFCALIHPATLGTTSVTSPINFVKQNFRYEPYDRTVLKGIQALWHPGSRDQVFKFIQLKLPGETSTSSSLMSSELVESGDANKTASLDEYYMTYVCPSGRAMTGMKSTYDSDATVGNSTWKGYRSFYVECGMINNYVLKYSNEQIAKEGTEPEAADWSKEYAGVGVSFSLVCPGKDMVLAGIKTKFVFDNRTNKPYGRGWMILCLTMERVS